MDYIQTRLRHPTLGQPDLSKTLKLSTYDERSLKYFGLRCQALFVTKRPDRQADVRIARIVGRSVAGSGLPSAYRRLPTDSSAMRIVVCFYFDPKIRRKFIKK